MGESTIHNPVGGVCSSSSGPILLERVTLAVRDLLSDYPLLRSSDCKSAKGR